MCTCFHLTAAFTLWPAAAVDTHSHCQSSNFTPSITNRPVQAEGFFLNVNFPISCTGTVTAWKFCYYLEELEDYSPRHESVYGACFAVYHRTSLWNYRLNIGSSITVTRFGNTTGRGDLSPFVCETIDLSRWRQFSVNKGDIIGVVSVSNDHTALEPLSVISEEDSADTYVVHDEDEDFSFCRLVVNSSPFRVLRSHLLHVAVVIGKLSLIGTLCHLFSALPVNFGRTIYIGPTTVSDDDSVGNEETPTQNMEESTALAPTTVSDGTDNPFSTEQHPTEKPTTLAPTTTSDDDTGQTVGQLESSKNTPTDSITLFPSFSPSLLLQEC